MESDFNINCPYCLESIWVEFYIQDGEKQEQVIDCEVCCNPILYNVNFNQEENNILTVQRLNS